MTYRDRREAKADRLRGWAEKRRVAATATLDAISEQFRGDYAFNTQPGHIPERARVIAREDRAFESMRTASGMEQRAAGIETETARAIYSDDHDAVAALTARIAGLEAERARCKAVNAEIRRGPGWAERISPPLTEQEGRDLRNAAQFNAVVGYPSCHMANLGGNIRRQKERRAELLTQAPPSPPRAPCGCGPGDCPDTTPGEAESVAEWMEVQLP